MSIKTMTSIHSLVVLKPQIGQGASMGAKRVFVAVRTVAARVKPVAANKVMFFAQTSQEVDHNLWFNEDPLLTEADMVAWMIEGVTVIIRITRVPMNLHGLNRIWCAGGMAKREDNISIVTPDTPLT